MSIHKSDRERIEKTRNVARFCVENRHISWILLMAVMAWGVWGLFGMPQRKDPYLAVRVAVAMCPWPGMQAEKVEQQVTRKIEMRMAENDHVKRIQSTSRTGLSVVTVELAEDVEETGEIFDDIDLKLRAIGDLPEGAGPIYFLKDFGDTAALMLTVASPPASMVEVELRAREVARAVENLRAKAKIAFPGSGERVSLALVFTHAVSPSLVARQARLISDYLVSKGLLSEVLVSQSENLLVVDGWGAADDDVLIRAIWGYAMENLHASEISPDIWDPAVIRDPATAAERLAAVAGGAYSYRDLERFTEAIQRRLLGVPLVSKVSRWGVLDEAVYLEYSQERLASYGLDPWRIKDVLGARNVTTSAGMLEFEGKNVIIDPSGEFVSEKELGDAMISSSKTGTGAYLRDLTDLERAYRSPAENLNYFLTRDKDGTWRRVRAVTLAAFMRKGGQISEFSEQVNAALADISRTLPPDLILERTSDQPLQVEENVELFMEALGDAVILVVLVSLIGFWEWRSALLMALSIPITLAMTFGGMHLLGIDLQQVSIASLILALGLLVDDPVVANDAIKRDLALGHSRLVSSWLGPTKLAKAILYATITNCVAYLPFLMLKGDTGRYLHALPVVVTLSLVASRIVSMTFIPFLGYYLLRPAKKAPPTAEERRSKGFSGWYFRFCGRLIDHRWKALAVSLLLVAGGFYCQSLLKPQFFPNDLSYLFYVDIWLPEDAPIHMTDLTALRTERIIQEEAARYGAAHPDKEGKPRDVLRRLTSFVGGGGPRFWFSVSPEMSQPNYAQILVETTDKWLTPDVVNRFQQPILSQIPGARVDVRQLESGKPVGVPVSIRLSGEDAQTLLEQAEKLKSLFRAEPLAYRARDDWGSEIFRARLRINPDKANMAGLTNADVARSSAAAMNGLEVTRLREGRLSIPVVLRMRGEERARLDDLQNLYVYSSDGEKRVPLRQVSEIEYAMEPEKIARRDQRRTITVSCFPIPGTLASEVMASLLPKLEDFEKTLPPGMKMAIGGEHEEQVSGFKDLTVVLVVSVVGIYLALLFQFNNAVKPLIVFATVPYGAAGAFAALYLMDSPFGFMAFLGVISLIGVIVSHIIVLFDFIEEKLEEGEDLRMALLDAGILRLRPVMITVGATVIALFPLAASGGPLWEPLCYAQIGGLTAATAITLLMAPVIYAIAAFDLKVVK